MKYKLEPIKSNAPEANIFAILGRVSTLLMEGGENQSLVDEMVKRVKKSGSYNNAIRVINEYCEITIIKSSLRVVIKKVDENPAECLILNDLESMQRIVNGYLESVSFASGIVMICNEEGKFKSDCGPNFSLNGDTIHGDVFFTQVDVQGNNIDLTDNQIKYILDKF
jgi:hypothetical protein